MKGGGRRIKAKVGWKLGNVIKRQQKKSKGEEKAREGDRGKSRRGTVKVNRCAYTVQTFIHIILLKKGLHRNTHTHTHSPVAVPSSNIWISQCNLTPPCSAGFIPADSN